MSLIRSKTRAGGHFNYIRFMMRLRIPMGVATMMFAALGLLSNYWNVDVLQRPLVTGAATHPITALSLFGIGLCVIRLRRFGQAPAWRYVIGFGIIGVCVTRLMQAELSQITGAPAVDIFGPVAGFNGRFSVESAITLGAFAMAGVLRKNLPRWGIAFLVVGLATVFTTLLELNYGLIFFNGDVGAFTLLGLMCAAVSMVTIYIHRPLFRVLFLVGNSGSQTRIMAVAAIVIPWSCGYVLHAVRDIGIDAVPFEAAMVSLITWSFLIVLLVTASGLESTDLARRRAEREIALLSRIDPLTKAFNRFAMSEMLDTAWVDFKSSGAMTGVLLLDVDYFRRINETFGSDTKDDVLERLAATLQPQLRDHDALARWNEEEFLILLKIKARSDLDVVVDRLTNALRNPTGRFCAGLDVEPTQITATFGISDMRDNDGGPADMIARADAVLHIAKEASVDKVVSRFEYGDFHEDLFFTDDGGPPDDLAA